MNYISVCSGIEAATVAWHPLGWKAAAYSEIELFPSAVLAHHYPDVPNVGDMTKYKEWNIEPGTVDLLVGGTPCQSFSVAGLRKGLADPRGNLALVYCGILDHFKPRWFVWENVPGVLSSGSGRDFGSFLGALAELGYGFAYRVLDAQYFGVAQRRRRVFVVGYLGDWRPAAKVFFEPESLRGDSAPSREKGQTVARGIEIGPAGGRFTDLNPTLDARAKDGPIRNQLAGAVMQPYPIANTLTARMHKGINSTLDEGQTPVIAWDEELNATIEQAGTLLRGGDGGRHDGVLVPVAVDTYNGTITGDLAATLSTRSGVPDATGPSVMTPVAFHPTQDPISSTEVCHRIGANENATAAVAHAITWDEELNASVEQAGTLLRGGQGGRHDGVAVATVAAFKGGQGSAAGGIGYDEHIAPTLSAADSGSNRTPALLHAMQVRRLTPVECERLQGFPDNYTAIPWRKKPASECPDGPRYKALGNSMAVPVMAWIGRRIKQLEG